MSADRERPKGQTGLKDMIKTDITSVRRQYDRHMRAKAAILAACGVMVFVTAVFSICVGAADLSFSDVVHAFWADETVRAQPNYDTTTKIVWLLRMPRVIMAVFAGAGLALCGTVMQGITRNPLVSPYTVGISNAASFGVAAVVLFSGKLPFLAGIDGQLMKMAGAFLMAMLCAAGVYGVSAARRMNVTTLVLMGTALSYLFSALSNTMQYLANEQELSTIVHWTFGSLQKATWPQVGIVAGAFVAVFVVSMFYARHLNAMAGASEDVPRALGIHVTAVRLITGILTVMLSALVISFVGVIGFVGIVAPHIARMIVGSDHRTLIPLSCICGGMLLVLSDTIGRTLFSPVVIPVGIVVAYVGVPIFVHLILSQKRGRALNA